MTSKKGSWTTVAFLITSFLLCQCGTDGGTSSPAGPGGNGSLADTLFADGFEQGIDLWDLSPMSIYWVLSSDAHTGSHSMEAWDNVNALGSAEITQDFDLSGYDSATLSFWSKTNYSDMLPETAEASVLVEVDDSILLQTIWSQTFQVNQPWTAISIGLDQYCNGASQKLEITFRYYKSQSSGEIQWWIDDVLLAAASE